MKNNLPPELHLKKTSGLAIASLILGICSCVFCFVTGIPAIMCGALALQRMKKNILLKGQALAIVGIIMGSVFTLIVVPAILTGLAVPVVTAALEKAKQAQEVACLREVGLLLFNAANNNDGKYPDSLEDFIATSRLSQEEIARLFYKKDSKIIRWDYRPGLTTTSNSRQVLIQSCEVFSSGRARGRVIYTVGNSCSWVEE
ncbi:MAG: DUF4190 domain-containing protein [Blastochloris sp.]|nr:DUF4190 domain-containing protein [Blastochloris sp.]